MTTENAEKSAKAPASRATETHRQRQRRVLFTWWAELTDQPASGADEQAEGGPGRPNRRGDRAELRRCSSLGEVAFCDGYLRLRSRLQEAALSPPLPWLAVVAATLAHLKEHTPAQEPRSKPNLGAQLGAPQGEKATLSGARFRRLLVASEPDDVFRQMVRVVRLLGGRMDVDLLAADLLDLGGERADDVRKEWAFAYFEASPEK